MLFQLFHVPVQKIVAGTLGIKESDVNIKVRRLGGGFGGKISQPNNVAAACAVAASKLRRPVRMRMDLQTNMEMLGKRLPYLVKYKASVDGDKKLTGDFDSLARVQLSIA